MAFHFISKLIWQMKFFTGYILAVSCHQRSAKMLLFFVDQAFAHPWVTRVTLEFWPATPTHDNFKIDAPVVLSVWRRDRRAMVMSVYFLGKCLYIRQLQGAYGINMPSDLEWAKRFVGACQTFSCAAAFEQIRLVRASELVQYHNPRNWARARRGETLEEAKARVRKKMLIHYDQTAQQLGFKSEGRWTIWRPSPATR